MSKKKGGCLVNLRSNLITSLYKVNNLTDDQFNNAKKEIHNSIYQMMMNTSITEKIKTIDGLKPIDFTNHSGGALGADSLFDEIGKSLGFTNQVHYYKGTRSEDNAPIGNTHIKQEDADKGSIEAAKAAKRNFGFTSDRMSDSRLVRNWSQVKYSDSIYAISSIVDTGEKLFPDQKEDTRVALSPSVTGGTGYAVGMAINNNKQVYVFNQNASEKYPVGWYKYDNSINDFQSIDIPLLTKNYAGIGSRNLNENGKKAIKDLYENTISYLNYNNELKNEGNQSSGSGPKKWLSEDGEALLGNFGGVQNYSIFTSTIRNITGDMKKRTDSESYHKNLDSLIDTIQYVLNSKGFTRELHVELKKVNDKYTNARFIHGDDEVLTEEEDGSKYVASSDTLEIRFADDTKQIPDTDNPNVMLDTYDNGLQGTRELVVHDLIHGMIDNAMNMDKELYNKANAVQKQFAKLVTVDKMISSIKERSGHDATPDQIEQLKDIVSYINGSPIEFMMYALTNPIVYDIMEKESTGKAVEYNLIDTSHRETRDKREKPSRFVKLMDMLVDIINNTYRKIKIGATVKDGVVSEKSGLDVLKELTVNAMIKETEAYGLSKEDKMRHFVGSKYESYNLGGKLNLSDKYREYDQRLKDLKDNMFEKTMRTKDKLKVTDKIEQFGSWMNKFDFIKQSREDGRFRLFSDVVNTIVEDTTSRDGGAADFYQIVRDIQGSRDRDKVAMVNTARDMLDKEWLDVSKDKRASATKMLQADWKALDLDIDSFKKLLEDSSAIDTEIGKLKLEIGQTEYNENAKFLGYYIIHGVSKSPELMKNANMIVNRRYSRDSKRPLVRPELIKETIKKVDKLATLYAMKYMDNFDKDNIIDVIENNRDLVEATSMLHYNYNEDQLSKFHEVGLDTYIAKGYVRKSSEVPMNFEILEKKDIRKGKLTAHTEIRKDDAVTNLLGINGKEYYLVVSRDYETSRTQGGFDDVHIIDKELGIRNLIQNDLREEALSTGIDNSLINTRDTFRLLSNSRARIAEAKLNTATRDDITSISMLPNQLVPSYDVNGNIIDYEVPIGEEIKRKYGRQINDIANSVAHTISHINVKENAIKNNIRFAQMLVNESEANEGKDGYVLLRPSTKDERARGVGHKYDQEWAMIPSYIQDAILNRDREGNPTREGLWVKEGRLNNIIGYKDPSIANLKLMGKDLSDYPDVKRAVQVVENYWKALSSRYKEIIVKYFPKVVFSNFTSNMWVAMRHGVGPIEYAKAFIRHWNSLTEYLELEDEIIRLSLSEKMGRDTSSRIEALKYKQSINPFNLLIKDGQFSTIIEDIDMSGMTQKSHIEDYITSFTNKFDKVGAETKEVLSNVYATRGSNVNRNIEKLTVFNDIINRSIITERLMQDLDSVQFDNQFAKDAKVQDLLNYADMLFVNYGYRDNKYLKWANDMNILMFTKYFFRALKANIAMMSRHPLASLGYESFDTFVYDASDSFDQYLDPVTTVSRKIFIDPVEMFKDSITPHTFNFFRI